MIIKAGSSSITATYLTKMFHEVQFDGVSCLTRTKVNAFIKAEEVSNMDNKEERMFFSSMCKAINGEDRELRKLFANNDPLYAQQHNGICCLYETTMVYLVFKQLMKDSFPYTVSWEHPYPNNNSLKADMGILNADNSVNSLVEFKIWFSEKGDEVRADVEKYNQCNFTGDKYLCIIEYGGPDMNDNCKFLMDSNPELVFISMKAFNTYFFDSWKTRQRIYNPVNMYFFKIKNSF